MSTAIALAAPGLVVESQVIAGAASHGIEIRRRCVDAADLLGACMGGAGLPAVITARLPRLSVDAVTRLRESGSMVIGIAVKPEECAELSALGVDQVIEPCASAPEVLTRLSNALESGSDSRGVWNVGMPDEMPTDAATPARVIAIWGPAGAPGRTTTALVLARALSQHGRTVIIDADSAAPSIALALGLAEDLSGLILACRHAETGSLSSRSLASSMSVLSPSYCALTGLMSARRWPELRPRALERVLEQVRADFRYAVVDVGSAFSNGESSLPSLTAPADVALAEADVIVAVCHAEPLGAARFLHDLPHLAEFGVPIVAALTGGAQRDQVRELICESAGRLGVSIPIADLVLDANTLAHALRRGSEPTSRRRWPLRARATSRLVELVA